MINETLDLKDLTTSPIDGVLYILKSGVDYQITYANLVAPLNSIISILQAYQNQGLQTTKETSKSAPFTIALDANTRLYSIDFQKVSGSPLVKIGTTLSGEQISPELEVLTNEPLDVNIGKTYTPATTIYVGISGGTVNININYRPNYF